MSDYPKVVREILEEDWRTDSIDAEWLNVHGHGIAMFGTSLTDPSDDAERARQAALGHLALQAAARHLDDNHDPGALLDELRAILTTLRTGGG